MNENNNIKDIKRVLIAIGRTNNAIHKLSKKISPIDNISSARWQVLSGIYHIKTPTVSAVARALKSTRQNISVLVTSMLKEGLVAYKENSNHKSSKILFLTNAGMDTLINVTKHRDELCGDIGIGISIEDLQTTRTVLQHLTKVLENKNKK